MSTPYAGNPLAVQAPSAAPAPGVAPVVSLVENTDGNTTANMYQAWKVCADFIAYLQLQALGSPFGNGSDGNATLDGSNTVTWATKVGSVYTMTRDCFCNNLTVTGAGTILKPNGFRIFGRGTLTTAAGGVISYDGINASGLTGGVALATGTLLGGGAGRDAVAGNNPGVSAVGITGFGGSGGRAGDGATNGGNGGAVTNPGATLGNPNAFNAGLMGFIQGLSGTTPTVTAIAGGAGGGSAGGSPSGNGGGSGGGGGVIAICFRAISLASAGDIHCNGGNGANGGSGAGGGGGGGGGVLLIAYGSKNSVTFSAATNCAAGALGTGTNFNATAASNGNVYEFQLT